MRTVKQVSELTGVSVRTLHYYDEIGLLKPSEVTESGYRLYDEEALETLRQILFFRELEFPLKRIKAIMESPKYDKKRAFENQRRLIQIKRDRLDDLLHLLDRLIEGEKNMSFQAFDMSGYVAVLEEFIQNNTDQIMEFGGDIEAFQQVVETLKSDKVKEAEVAAMAIKQYGSIEKYTEAMRENMSHFPEIMGQMNEFRENAGDYMDKSDELMKRLTSDLSRDVSSAEVQQVIGEIVNMARIPNLDMGEGYWRFVADGYLSSRTTIEITDKKYGEGASAFIGTALKKYWNL